MLHCRVQGRCQGLRARLSLLTSARLDAFPRPTPWKSRMVEMSYEWSLFRVTRPPGEVQPRSPRARSEESPERGPTTFVPARSSIPCHPGAAAGPARCRDSRGTAARPRRILKADPSQDLTRVAAQQILCQFVGGRHLPERDTSHQGPRPPRAKLHTAKRARPRRPGRCLMMTSPPRDDSPPPRRPLWCCIPAIQQSARGFATLAPRPRFGTGS